jgi:hypothetical protein
MNDYYFRWLIELIGDSYICGNYQKLLWKMHCREYVWELNLDENRASDGIYLRNIFANSMGINTGDYIKLQGFGCDISRPCSVLEMMIALARKAEDDLMHDPDFGDRSGKWFWQMMENLGLDIYDDYNFNEFEVDRIIDIFLHHTYANGGNGNAFPIRKKSRDLRNTDLWWQMNAYMEEQYGL